ncbi:hypothetical protein EYF80_011168 [Liparis tanakae]|uniref:Uncharacterized protein n=1 Tax=Liparis tanakae TaxID=230148 RepID=A0A4Z2IN44_9TELE|nr:hypothetical protein EYF80_011168 [Liparis tanakae]
MTCFRSSGMRTLRLRRSEPRVSRFDSVPDPLCGSVFTGRRWIIRDTPGLAKRPKRQRPSRKRLVVYHGDLTGSSCCRALLRSVGLQMEG